VSGRFAPVARGTPSRALRPQPVPTSPGCRRRSGMRIPKSPCRSMRTSSRTSRPISRSPTLPLPHGTTAKRAADATRAGPCKRPKQKGPFRARDRLRTGDPPPGKPKQGQEARPTYALVAAGARTDGHPAAQRTSQEARNVTWHHRIRGLTGTQRADLATTVPYLGGLGLLVRAARSRGSLPDSLPRRRPVGQPSSIPRGSPSQRISAAERPVREAVRGGHERLALPSRPNPEVARRMIPTRTGPENSAYTPDPPLYLLPATSYSLASTLQRPNSDRRRSLLGGSFLVPG